MKKQDDLTLMKVRSYRSVLMAGFRLYSENFRQFFKASWIMALLYALCCGATGTLTVINLSEMMLYIVQMQAEPMVALILAARAYALVLLQVTAISLIACAVMTLASATILNKLKEHKDTGTITLPPHWLSGSPRLMGRTLKGVLLTTLVAGIPLLLFVAIMAAADALSPGFTTQHIMTVMGTFMLLTLIVMVFALPLAYVLMKYIMEPSVGYWRRLKASYAEGMRHWGGLFLVFFVSLLVIALIDIVVMTPAYILNFANQQAYMGQLIGDPLGMPSYMKALTFATFTLCSFIQFYVCQVTLMHNYYIYGSIDTKVEERNKQ